MHPETAVSFNSKHPDTTLWIEIEHPIGDRPQPLIDALAEIGFVEDGLAKAPEVEGIPTVVCLAKAGSDLFRGWTASEAVEFECEARAVLSRFGFDDVPVNQLSYADLG